MKSTQSNVTKTSSKNFLKFLACLVASGAAGAIGTIFTIREIPTWYAGLSKPPLNPPPWVFGPVWTTLYILMGLAAFLIWRKGLAHRGVRLALGIFILQLVLNALWSFLFFGLQSPTLGLICIILLWLSIVWTMVAFGKISRPAMYLLIPYIAWVSFASYLNFGIWLRN
jgi:tryptophan-rich sensory protein